ncbi:hypothetical protein NQ314_006064 [Rhamnusium bicolor]|uniref:Uncharacterized protein n=1 Tax=Rhamnusium bicolor TaxID=1586634 RepID=A0AAV8Z8Z8_9CUCU|nr:hypothetical protein NQ314_006064 [Rhamnusium bicolor]
MAGEKLDEICGYQTLFRELGYYISRLELYEKSLTFFNEALRLTPNDKRALIGRSRARAKACQYDGAIQDINRALSLDADDLVVLTDKALNTYLSCEFEEGLVQNTRLLPIRQKPVHFAMGVMHCSNAIENCVGERAGRPLRDHFRVIRKLAWKKNHEAQKPFEPKPRKSKTKERKKSSFSREEPPEPVAPSLPKKTPKLSILIIYYFLGIKDSLYSHEAEENVIPPYNQPFLFKPLQNYTTNIENYIAEKYLDSMYLDKIFLNKLQTRPGAVCPNHKGSAKIKKLSKTGFKTVCYKQELLRTRRPFYYIKFQEATVSGALKFRQEQELKVQQQIIKKEADVLLSKMQDAFKERRMRNLLDIAEKLKLYCDSKSKRLLMDKDIYLDEIYALVRRGFYDLNRLNKKFDDTQAPKVLEKREKTIVSMMASAKMKDEVTHLFRMMSVMPASRRMLVMPGVRLEDIERASKQSRKLSIMPVAGKQQQERDDSVSLAARNRAHKDTRKIESRGVGFFGTYSVSCGIK